MDVPKYLLEVFKTDTDSQSDIFNGFLQAIPSFVYLLDLTDKKAIYLNTRNNIVSGYSPKELFSNDAEVFPIQNFISAEHFFQFLKDSFKDAAINDSQTLVLKIKTQAGQKITVSNKVTLTEKDDDELPSVLMVLADDITVQNKIVDKTTQVQNQLNDAEKLFNYGSWEWWVGDNFVIWSDGLYEMFGYDKNDFKDSLMPYGFYQKHISPKDITRVIKVTMDALDERKEIYEYEHEMRDNKGNIKQIAVRGKCFLDEKGEIIRVLGTSHDITEITKIKQELETKVEELSKAYDELRKSKDLFKEAEAMMSYGSYEWNVQKDDIQFSDGLKRLYAGSDITKLPPKLNVDFCYNRMPSEDLENVKNVLHNAIAYKEPYSFEHKIVDLDGIEKDVHTKGWVTIDEAGNTLKLIGNTVEVTELKVYEKELERKIEELNQTNQELGQFAYVASHDLKEPLRKITAFGDRLNQKYSQQLDENGRFYLSRMIDSAKRMEVLMENLLSYSRLSRKMVSFERLDLNKTIDNVLSDLEIKINETNAQVYVTKMPILEASVPKMHQLFQNLISNALKFVKPNQTPEIHIDAKEATRGELIRLGLDYKNKKYCKITVKDNGIGFEQEYAEKIFVIFQRLHGRAEFDGTGLGLAICRKIVENHQGLIMADGIPDEGATFTIFLPTDPDSLNKKL